MLGDDRALWRNQCVAGVPILRLAVDGHLGAERKRRKRRRLDVGLGEGEGAKRRDLVGRLVAGLSKRLKRRPADIAVGCELHPGPALRPRLEHRQRLAEQRLGQERGAVRRCVTEWCARRDDPHRLPRHEPRGLDLAHQRESARSARNAFVAGVESFSNGQPSKARAAAPTPSPRPGRRAAPGRARR